MKRQTGGLNDTEIEQLLRLYKTHHSQYSTYLDKALLFISLGFLINEDTHPNELKTLSGRLESNIFDQVNIILNTTDEATIQRNRELMNQIYQKLAAMDEEIKLMVESIDVDLAAAPAVEQHQLWSSTSSSSTCSIFLTTFICCR